MRFQILLSFTLVALAVANSIPNGASNQVHVAARDVVSGANGHEVAHRDLKQLALRRRNFPKRNLIAPDGLLQEVGELLATLEKALGVTALENALDKVLPLEAVEESLGLTKLEESLNLLKGCSKDGVLQYVGKLVKYLEDTLGVTALENALDKKLLGGNLSKLEDSLGLTKVLEGLDLAKRQQNSRRHLTAPDGLLQGVGKLLAALEKALGVTALEDALDKVLPLEAVEESLGLTKLEESLDLLKGCSKDGVLQYVGKLVKYLEDTLGVTALEDKLNQTLGGGLYKLFDSLGLTKVEEGLDL